MVDFVDNTPATLRLGNNRYRDATFTAAAANTYPAGMVLGQLTADSKYVPYDAGGAGGAEIPKAVLPNELVTTAGGDTVLRILTAGDLREEQVTAWNSGTPIALTDLEVAELRDFMINLIPTRELLIFDNNT